MKLEINGNILTVQRETGDKRVKRSGYAGTGAFDGSSGLLYAILKRLNAAGCDLIKKRMSRDGHLVNDEKQYLRTRKPSSKGPHIYITDERYALRCAGEDFNKGEIVNLTIHPNVFNKQPDCSEQLAAIAANLKADAAVPV